MHFLYLWEKHYRVDIINLLPDSIANQIAAGEVIQRPSSVVKELLENSVDAGAKHIKLSIKNAGKQSIQVIDDGKGMSENDARMAFERHATSKIKTAEDLYSLSSMGFRGEALASIASIAQVDLKTKQENDQLGTKLEISENTLIDKSKEPMNRGTQITVKNLFYNVPARRKFLKKDSTEIKHILEEFIRVALAFPEVQFSFYNNDKLLHDFPAGNRKSRVLHVLGKSWETKLLPVSMNTEHLKMEGYIAKPEKATKSRSNQYFILNNRFIRSGYLHHAIQRAFQGLIEEETHPSYVLYMEVDPASIDVNVHPTKQEIKFENESILYSYIQSAIKHSLGKYSVTPALDFDMDTRFDELDAFRKPNSALTRERTHSSSIFKSFQQPNQAHKIGRKDSSSDWAALIDIYTKAPAAQTMSEMAENELFQQEESKSSVMPAERASSEAPVFQLNAKYIVTTLSAGLLLIRQHQAQTKILYERYKAAKEEGKTLSQNLISPIKIELDAREAVLLDEHIDEINSIGFDIGPFGQNEFVIQAGPIHIPPGKIETHLKNILAEAQTTDKTQEENYDPWLYKMAKATAVPAGQKLSQADMEKIIAELFALPDSAYTPRGEKTFLVLKDQNLEEIFK